MAIYRGFVSDRHDRFLDDLVIKITEEEILHGNTDVEIYYENEDEIEEISEKLLEEIKNYMKKIYKEEGFLNERGDYTGCYYKNKEGLKAWSEFGE